MKHLKKLSAAFMLAALLSSSLTSCISTGVDPAVQAIYTAQADLLAAQTAVQTAEATYVAAQAASEQANADYRAAQTAQIEVSTANQVLVNEQYLLALVAQTNLQVANSQNALAIAQAQFDLQMASLLAQLNAAGANLAAQYANSYNFAMNDANLILSQKLTADQNLANAMLLQTNGGVSYTYWLSQLQGNVDNAMAAKTVVEDAITAAEAYLANPSTPEAMVSTLQDANTALQALKDTKNVELASQQAIIDGLIQQNDVVRSDLTLQFDIVLGDHNSAVMDKNDRTGWIATANTSITAWQTALTNYAAALAILNQAVVDAQTDEATAQGVWNTANAAQIAANTAWTTAAADLTTLEGVLAGLEGTLQVAANNLNAAQLLYDAGIGAATALVTSTGGDVTTANTGVTNALAAYTLWKTRFEGGTTVNGGFYWEDTTITTAAYADLANDVLGIHTDASGASSSSYVRVSSWANLTVAPDDNVGDNYEPALILSADLPVGNVIYTPGVNITDADLANAYPNVGYTTEYFIEVGTDDVSYDNLVQMNLASTALGNQHIFDIAPTLGATLLVGIDAYTVLWNATVLNLNAIDALNNFGADLAAKQLIYDDLKAVYENELTLLDAAQLLEASTATTLATANTDLVTAATNLTNAQNAVITAQGAVTTFMLCDATCLQGNIDVANADIAAWTAEIALIQPIIDARYAVLDGMLADLTAAGVEYTFALDADGLGVFEVTNLGLITFNDPDLEVLLIAANQAYWNIEFEIIAINFEMGVNNNMIVAYGSNDLVTLQNALDTLNTNLATAINNIELANQALASGQVEADAAAAQITYYEALVASLSQRYDNAIAIADNYKALMLAALGN